VLKDAKWQGKHAVLVRDKLFVNGSILFRWHWWGNTRKPN
jgi:hypothetical protein